MNTQAEQWLNEKTSDGWNPINSSEGGHK